MTPRHEDFGGIEVEQDKTWCNDHINLTLMGRLLINQGIDIENLQYYYEKPWKWTDEWYLFCATGSIVEEE